MITRWFICLSDSFECYVPSTIQFQQEYIQLKTKLLFHGDFNCGTSLTSDLWSLFQSNGPDEGRENE